MKNFRETISYILLPAMLFFTFRPAFAYVMIKQNRYNRQPANIQWYISNGKDVAGTTDSSGRTESQTYSYTPYGCARTLSSVTGRGRRQTVDGRGQTFYRHMVSSGWRSVAVSRWPACQDKILRSNNLPSKIKPCRADLSRRSSELRTKAEVLNAGGPCRAEATRAGGNLTQLRQGFRLRKATPGQASGQAFNINTNPFQYSGYYLDSLSGLYYLNARYYSAEFMRFINRDSYDLPNRYAYGDGNPISMIDPTGHNSVLNWLLAGGAVLGGIVGACFSGGSSLFIAGGVLGVLSGGTQIISLTQHAQTAKNWSYISLITGVAGLVCDVAGIGMSTWNAYKAAKVERIVAPRELSVIEMQRNPGIAWEARRPSLEVQAPDDELEVDFSSVSSGSVDSLSATCPPVRGIVAADGKSIDQNSNIEECSCSSFDVSMGSEEES